MNLKNVMLPNIFEKLTAYLTCFWLQKYLFAAHCVGFVELFKVVLEYNEVTMKPPVKAVPLNAGWIAARYSELGYDNPFVLNVTRAVRVILSTIADEPDRVSEWENFLDQTMIYEFGWVLVCLQTFSTTFKTF